MPALFRILPAWMLIATSLFAKEPVYSLHEWGTFTTLSTSKGKTLSGLFLDESPLPDSIYSLEFFHPKAPKPLPSLNSLRGVTVKMETSVIYFHSQDSFTAQVHVRFRGGSITQWFPECSSHEVNPTSPVTLTPQTQGGINWNVKILAPRDKPANTILKGSEEWSAPRLAESNSVQANNGEVEEFLFYRGLGGFTLPLALNIAQDGSLEMKYEGPGEIPFVLVVETPRKTHRIYSGEQPVMKVRWLGSLASHTLKRIDRTDTAYTLPGVGTVLPSGELVDGVQLAMNAVDSLQQALIKAGLNPDEAKSMLNTWRSSYFDQEYGLKIFWIVPRALVDSILPLQVYPAPQTTQRVFVGRSEILTPDFETLLLKAQAHSQDSINTLLTDRFQFAYRDFLDHKSTAIAKPNSHSISRVMPLYLAAKQDLLGRRKWAEVLARVAPRYKFGNDGY